MINRNCQVPDQTLFIMMAFQISSDEETTTVAMTRMTHILRTKHIFGRDRQS